MHDPLALACTVTDACMFEKKFVAIDLKGERGAAFVSDHEEAGYSPIYVAVSADREKFYNMVESVLL